MTAKPLCAHPDCDRPARSRGMCGSHYNAHMRETGQGRHSRLRGPCGHCGAMFPSADPRKYCSFDCYMASDGRAEIDAARAERMTRPKECRECMACGATMELRACDVGRGRRVCNRVCYRKYLADRFDRWVANPRSVDEIQGYDGFLSQEELPCPVDGCDWSGHGLSQHVNRAHGLPSEDFKALCGFNRTTALLSPSSLGRFRAQGEAAKARGQLRQGPGAANKGVPKPWRKEHAEHWRKAMGLLGREDVPAAGEGETT